jgi:hypothetical protein
MGGTAQLVTLFHHIAVAGQLRDKRGQLKIHDVRQGARIPIAQ